MGPKGRNPFFCWYINDKNMTSNMIPAAVSHTQRDERGEYIQELLEKLPATVAVTVEELGVYRNDALLVVYSPGYGAGWASWNHDTSLATYPPLVLWLLLGKDPNELMQSKSLLFTGLSDEGRRVFKYVGSRVYLGGVTDLVLGLVPRGSMWRIEEYDGSESLEIFNPSRWNKA